MLYFSVFTFMYLCINVFMNEFKGLPAILPVHGICRNRNLSSKKNLGTHICVFFKKRFEHVLVCFRIRTGAARCERTIQ